MTRGNVHVVKKNYTFTPNRSIHHRVLLMLNVNTELQIDFANWNSNKAYENNAVQLYLQQHWRKAREQKESHYNMNAKQEASSVHNV